MTLKELLAFLEGYYGEKYSGVFLDVMVSYLSGGSKEFYKAIAQVIIKRYSRTFNKSPGPAEIEKCLDEIYETVKSIRALIALPEPKQEITKEERQTNMSLVGELLDRLSNKKKGRFVR
jgi:hypothetical protein